MAFSATDLTSRAQKIVAAAGELLEQEVYRLMTERPLPRALLRPSVEERAALPLLQAAGAAFGTG